MLKSMTGFAKEEVSYQGLNCSIELRSVNHKSLECKIKLPREYQTLEEILKKELRKDISRGKLDVMITLTESEENKPKLVLDQDVWENTEAILNELKEKTGKELPVTFSDMLNIQGLVTYQTEEKNAEDYEQLFLLAVRKGSQSLSEMREREGRLLYEELQKNIQRCSELIEAVPPYCDQVVDNYREKLKKNLEKLNIDFDPDDPRIVQEIAISIDRCDVTEEITRFKVHLVHLDEIMNKSEPTGKKLGFLLQELNREANTLCSKGNHTEIQGIGVDLKCEIEKIREQIMNIE